MSTSPAATTVNDSAVRDGLSSEGAAWRSVATGAIGSGGLGGFLVQPASSATLTITAVTMRPTCTPRRSLPHLSRVLPTTGASCRGNCPRQVRVVVGSSRDKTGRLAGAAAQGHDHEHGEQRDED